jgi:hypothetical protein
MPAEGSAMEGWIMTVYEGVLGTLSGGTQQTSLHGGSNAWVRLEFLTIGDQRLKSIRLSNYHVELLKTVVGRPVALSVFKGADAEGAGRNDLLVTAVRLPDGSIEKLPPFTAPSLLRAWFDLFRLSVFFFTVGYIADMVGAPLVIIPAVVLELIIVFGFFQRKIRNSRRVSHVNATVDDLDGRAFQPAAPA